MMVVRTVRMPKLISSVDPQSSRRRSALARDRPRGTREHKQLAKAQRARSLVPRLWAHKALDAAGDHIHVCLL